MRKRITFLLIAMFSLQFSAQAAESTAQNIVNLNLDDLWVLVAAALVFFMQAGFKVLETGLVKKEHRAGIGAKNLLDWVAGSIAFFLVGFAFMFGDSSDGLIGINFFLGNGLDTGKEFIFFLFQLAFAGTALTIVSGAMSGRTGVLPYFIASLMTAMVIYPIFGHWAWGNLLIEENQPWLAALGFMDFAGSTVVHSTGAWVAVVGIQMVGPRLGRYDADGNIQSIKASDYSYSILGVMILWLGWWGFNGGSTLAFNDDVAKIILNTNLAGAAACFAAYFHAVFFQRKEDVIEKIAGGSLTGLVAITACCNVVTPISSLMIGLIAGIIHNIFYVFLSEKLKLDDPVGAIAVHGIGGVFGTLSVALFGEAELLVHDRWWQLSVQLIGIATCFIFTTSISVAMFYLIKKAIGLRVSPVEEMHGAFVENVVSEDEIPESDKKKIAQISIKISKRGYNTYTVNEYLKIDQESRQKLIDQGRVSYLDKNGSLLSPLVAARQLGRHLESEKDQITKERDQLSAEHLETQSNIARAGKIQSALFNDQEGFKDMFGQSFLIFNPKAQISGDFYWFKKITDYKVLIVANSNASGVSGGFFSMLGISLINEIFSTKGMRNPETVLDLLDQKLVKSLRVKSLGVKLRDSMDVSVVIIDELRQNIFFAGANNGLHHFSRNQIKSYPGDHFSVGMKEATNNTSFKRESFKYKEGDMIYLFTDGYYKQVNKHGAKLSKDDLLDQIQQIRDEKLSTQKQILESDFQKWSEGCKQSDDVLVIGIKMR